MSKYTIKCLTCGRIVEFSDGLFGNKTLPETYTCPMCSTIIDVAKAAAMSDERKKGLVSVIQYEGDNNVFIWKHPVQNFNKGTQHIVHESQEAIFFRDGKALDLFGAGRYTLDTANLPLLQALYSLPTNADTPFQCEVYFINKTVQMGIKWGTPDKVRFIDPLTGTPLEIGASGEMNLMVSDSRRLLLKLVGTTSGIAWDDEENGYTKSLSKALRPLISSSVKVNLPTVIKRNDIDLLEIDEKLNLISDDLKNRLIPDFEEYGLTIPQLYVTNIALPEDDPNFKRIRELHTVTLQQRVLQAQANVKIAEAQNETLYRTEQEKAKRLLKRLPVRRNCRDSLPKQKLPNVKQSEGSLKHRQKLKLRDYKVSPKLRSCGQKAIIKKMYCRLRFKRHTPKALAI